MSPQYGMLAGALARARSGEEDIRRKKKQDDDADVMKQLQQAALLANLEEQGIIPSDQQETIKATMPDIRVTANGHPEQRVPQGQTVDTEIADPNRYRSIGKTGYVQDTTRTKRAKEIATGRERERKLKQRSAVLRARGVPDTEIPGIVEDDNIYAEYAKPQSAGTVNWQLVETPEGYVQVNPRTGEKRPLNIPLPADRGSRGSFAPGTDGSGNPIFFNPTTRETVAGPPGFQGGTGAMGEKTKRIQALANVDKALDLFEATFDTTGSRILPSADKAALESDYENLQLQLKELYNLGVLNGPDLALMRRILKDPTSLQGRAEAMGSGELQGAMIKAQIAKVREKIGAYRSNLEAGNQAGKGTSVNVDALLKKHEIIP